MNSRSFSLPGPIEGVADTRHQTDLTNIQALVSVAQSLIARSGAAQPISFRDATDQTHALTPEQMIEVGMLVTQHHAAIYATSWAHKDAIMAALDEAALAAIDITSGWPV